jgi:4-amino-4-deoxychorismate lyase
MSRVRIWSGEQTLAALSPLDRGLAYGDGVFESIRVINRSPVLMAYHWARLSASCVQLGLPDLPFWRQAFRQFLAELQPEDIDGVVRLQVTRGVSERGYLPDPNALPTLILSWHSAASYPAEWSLAGIEITQLDMPLAIQPRLAGIKHLNRLEQVLLRQDLSAMPNCQEGLVCDAEGHVVEGVFSNVFAVINGQLCTPSLARCGVRGVLREALLAELMQQNIAVNIRDISLKEMASATEIFFCNSLYGIWPVARWGNKTWQAGPVTRQCQSIVSPWFMHNA